MTDDRAETILGRKTICFFLEHKMKGRQVSFLFNMEIYTERTRSFSVFLTCSQVQISKHS